MYSRISKFRNASVSTIPKSEQAQIQTCQSSFEGSSTDKWLGMVAETPSKSLVHIFRLNNGVMTSKNSEPPIVVSCNGEVLWMNILNGDARERSENESPDCCTLTVISRGGLLSSWLVYNKPEVKITPLCSINIPIRSGRVSCVRPHPSARGIFAVCGIGSGLWIVGLGTKPEEDKEGNEKNSLSRNPFSIPVPVDKQIHSLDWGIDREGWKIGVAGEVGNDSDDKTMEMEIQLHSTLYILCYDGWVYRADAGYAICSASQSFEYTTARYCMPTIRLFHFTSASIQPQQDAPFKVSPLNKAEIKDNDPSKVPPVMQSHLFVMRNWDSFCSCNGRYSTTPIILCTPDNRTGKYSLSLYCVITDYMGKYEDHDCTHVMCFQLSTLDLASEVGGLPPLHFDNTRTVPDQGTASHDFSYTSIILCGGYGRNNVIWFGIAYGGIPTDLITQSIEKSKTESLIYEYIMPGTKDKRAVCISTKMLCDGPTYTPQVEVDSYISQSGIIKLGVYNTNEMTKVIVYQDSCYSGIVDAQKDQAVNNFGVTNSGSTEYLTRFFIAGARYLSPVTLQLNRTAAANTFNMNYDKTFTPTWDGEEDERNFISPQSPSHIKTSHEWVQQLIGCGHEYPNEQIQKKACRNDERHNELEQVKPIERTKKQETPTNTQSVEVSKPSVDDKTEGKETSAPIENTTGEPIPDAEEVIPQQMTEHETKELKPQTDVTLSSLMVESKCSCEKSLNEAGESRIQEDLCTSTKAKPAKTQDDLYLPCVHKKLDIMFDMLIHLKADVELIKNHLRQNGSDCLCKEKLEEVHSTMEVLTGNMAEVSSELNEKEETSEEK